METDNPATGSDDWPADWNVQSASLIADTFSSHVWKVMLDDGTEAVIKTLKDFPEVYDELRGAYFLEWRDGIGAVRLLARQRRMMLLEFGGDRLLADVLAVEGDNVATGIAAETLARMLGRSDRPVPTELQPLRERFSSLFQRARAGGTAGRGRMYAEAAVLADELLSNPAAALPLHGDLHHDNIISGPRGWLVIDPKGALGDPAFDAANMFYNPLGEQQRLCLDENRIAFIAETFGATLGQSPAHILDFAFAYGCLSAAWHAEDGNQTDEMLELGVARAVRRVRLSF